MTLPASLLPPLVDEIAGQPIPDLVQQFGTPLYVYDAAKIVERIGDLASFDVVRFAQKACSNLAILDLVRRHGAFVDTVSAGEIKRALKAGFSCPSVDRPDEPPQIVYTADIFDQETLDLVVENNILVNCGSPDMIDQIGERYGNVQKIQREITLRINPGFGHGHSQKTNTGGEQSKHGIWHEQLGECLARAARYDLKVTGLHMHIGSGTDMEHLSQVCGAMMRSAMEVGPSLHTISAGGGLPVPYQEGDPQADIGAYYQLWNTTREQLAEALGHPIRLEIEPGRFLVAESGYLLSEIRAIKPMGDNLYYLVDAGFNNLARPILYGSYHPMALCRRGPLLHPGESLKQQNVIIGGPLCESGDIFTQEEGGFVSHRRLPEAQIGDFLVIGTAGAYGHVMSSNYNSKPFAAEVLLEEGQVHLIRARQTFEDMTRNETIPRRS